MATWIVTRHPGALEFLMQQGVCGELMPQLDMDRLQPGDQVVGTLPVQLVAELTQNGIDYWHLCLTQPFSERGQEHSATQMASMAATLRRFKVLEV